MCDVRAPRSLRAAQVGRRTAGDMAVEKFAEIFSADAIHRLEEEAAINCPALPRQLHDHVVETLLARRGPLDPLIEGVHDQRRAVVGGRIVLLLCEIDVPFSEALEIPERPRVAGAVEQSRPALELK